MVNDIINEAKEINCINSTPLLTEIKRDEKWTGWTMPIWLMCKLNTDEARQTSGEVGVDDVIGNHNGNWLIGMSVGFCSVTIAELQGLYQGLELACQNGIRQLEFEVDSLRVTQVVANLMELISKSIPLCLKLSRIASREIDTSLLIMSIEKQIILLTFLPTSSI